MIQIESIFEGSSAPSLQSKSATYTENGTATITPDEGYDGLSSVDVTVDVSGGGSTSSSSQTGVVDTSASYTMIYTYFPDAVSVTVPTRVVTATSAAGELQI